MKQSDIQVGATYRGKTGIRRRVLDFLPSSWEIFFIQLNPGGGYRVNNCYPMSTASFARWAVARVDGNGDA